MKIKDVLVMAAIGLLASGEGEKINMTGEVTAV